MSDYPNYRSEHEQPMTSPEPLQRRFDERGCPKCGGLFAHYPDCPILKPQYGAAITEARTPSPLPEEPPAELTAALDDLVRYEEALGIAAQKTDIVAARRYRDKADAARAALVALYDRQREAHAFDSKYWKEEFLRIRSERNETVASLSSQLECAIKERKFAASSALLLDDQFKQVCAELESERSQLERLKAEQMERTLNPREAELILLADPGKPIPERLVEKLRRLSGTGAHP